MPKLDNFQINVQIVEYWFPDKETLTFCCLMKKLLLPAISFSNRLWLTTGFQTTCSSIHEKQMPLRHLWMCVSTHIFLDLTAIYGMMWSAPCLAAFHSPAPKGTRYPLLQLGDYVISGKLTSTWETSTLTTYATQAPAHVKHNMFISSLSPQLWKTRHDLVNYKNNTQVRNYS